MKFIADIMVGKLARYLRMAGFDVLYDNQYDDDEILEIAKDQNRIVISRDSLMFKRREFRTKKLGYVFIEYDGLGDQLRQVRDEMGIDISPRFSRCIECNRLLEPVDKEKVKEKVPPYVYKTQQSFMHCPDCDRYYWCGTHYENMIKNIAKMM